MPENKLSLYDAREYWLGMNAQAEAGTLTIPPDVASKCDAACTEYLQKLDGMVRDTQRLVNVQAFGDFKSGQQLGGKFANSAQGTPTSLDTVLLQHIEIIDSMRTFFRRYFSDAEAEDQSNGGTFESLDPGN